MHLQALYQSPIQACPHATSSVWGGHGVSHADAILKPIGILNKDTDVEYMSFADAQKLPFTNEQHPLLAATDLRAASKKNKIADRLRVLSLGTFIATIVTKL